MSHCSSVAHDALQERRVLEARAEIVGVDQALRESYDRHNARVDAGTASFGIKIYMDVRTAAATATPPPQIPRAPRKPKPSKQTPAKPKPGKTHHLPKPPPPPLPNIKKRQVKESTKKQIACRQEWTCNLCHHTLPGNFEVDHIKPLHRGGSNEPFNLQALCRNCHGEKTQRENAGMA